VSRSYTTLIEQYSIRFHMINVFNLVNGALQDN
jgi:hypothetical protein